MRSRKRKNASTKSAPVTRRLPAEAPRIDYTMALFTIAEPGQSKPRHAQRRKLAVGIDLGTTNSLVATAKEGKAETLPVAEGAHLLPSIVSYGADGSVRVGEPAGGDATVISSAKRLMGRGIADIDYQLPYQLQQAPGGG